MRHSLLATVRLTVESQHHQQRRAGQRRSGLQYAFSDGEPVSCLEESIEDRLAISGLKGKTIVSPAVSTNINRRSKSTADLIWGSLMTIIPSQDQAEGVPYVRDSPDRAVAFVRTIRGIAGPDCARGKRIQGLRDLGGPAFSNLNHWIMFAPGTMWRLKPMPDRQTQTRPPPANPLI